MLRGAILGNIEQKRLHRLELEVDLALNTLKTLPDLKYAPVVDALAALYRFTKQVYYTQDRR